MAFNVYLVFFHNVRPSVFCQFSWVYCSICFGSPLITALALNSTRDDPHRIVFSDAVVSIFEWSCRPTLTSHRCGAGSTRTGALSKSTRTISPSGFVSSSQSSATSQSAVRSSTITTRYETWASAVSTRVTWAGRGPVGMRGTLRRKGMVGHHLDGTFAKATQSLNRIPKFYGTVVTEVQINPLLSLQNHRSFCHSPFTRQHQVATGEPASR